ncbi:ATP-dependent RNA helicase DbpA [Alteromonas pelagimontana]|uniref:ATP-dependent RNA helicase DbpA n=1 Tax=Alteromonas pelagimontana TaxID=1858656 RepID=A0A6M4MGT0_9ALTE|nr:ATP-dependent RNA helicase DbpA [Alteromonas pelagimontana]QJR81406.1 ATP-dependent RNA helicase DbpA [Alteromonas pelagimontana]
MTAFSTLSINSAILSSLDQQSLTMMTPVQCATLPDSLAGKDILAQAQTGSGKTVAFAVAALNKIDLTRLEPQVLILCPTRELADQVAEQIRRVGRQMPNLKVVALCGGQSIGPQIKSLQFGCHVIVGTPGRLMDHLGKRRLALSSVKWRVLDEADRMLDMGFADDVAALFGQTDKNAQTLLFSATYTSEIEALAKTYLSNPVVYKQEARAETQPDIEQMVYRVTPGTRKLALKAVLTHYQPKKAIVFCNTRLQVNEAVQDLQASGFTAGMLQGEMTQPQRTEVLVQFASDALPVLVATDVAARGLDIADVDCVINFAVSEEPEVHIHRIGRTARAGASGKAFTLCSEEEQSFLLKIQLLMGKDINSVGAQSLRFHANRIVEPEYVCIAAGAGKKQKLRPGDFLGSLTQDAQIPGDDIGKITVQSAQSYIAIKLRSVKRAMRHFREGKIKGKRVKARKVE